MHLHLNTSWAHRERPVRCGSNKGRMVDTELLRTLFYLCTDCVSWTKFNNSMRLYSEDDKERKTWKGRGKEKKKE